MATLKSFSLSPQSVPLGGTAQILVVLETDPGDQGRAFSVQINVEGEVGTATGVLGYRAPEEITFSADPNDAGKPDTCVVTASEGAVTAGENGEFTYTAPSA